MAHSNEEVGIRLSAAATSGALRGALAGGAYALVLSSVMVVEARQLQSELSPGTYVEGASTGSALVLLWLVLLVAVPTGAALGWFFGGLLVPLSRSLKPATANVLAGLGVTGVGAVSFPFIPLGITSHSFVLSLLPAALGGAAAAWHTSRLSRRV